MTRDQAIGLLIFLLCALVLIGYVAGLVWPKWIMTVLGWVGISVQDPFKVQFWLIAIPVALAFCIVLAIGAWIGWTMFTTPPPVPIEELEAELAAEETKEEAEEKAEEKEEEKKEQ